MVLAGLAGTSLAMTLERTRPGQNEKPVTDARMDQGLLGLDQLAEQPGLARHRAASHGCRDASPRQPRACFAARMATRSPTLRSFSISAIWNFTLNWRSISITSVMCTIESQPGTSFAVVASETVK